eukprot:203211_1
MMCMSFRLFSAGLITKSMRRITCKGFVLHSPFSFDSLPLVSNSNSLHFFTSSSSSSLLYNITSGHGDFNPITSIPSCKGMLCELDAELDSKKSMYRYSSCSLSAEYDRDNACFWIEDAIPRVCVGAIYDADW